MNTKGKAILNPVILASLISSLILILIAVGFFRASQMRFVRNNFSNHICPRSLSPKFEFTLSNTGSTGTSAKIEVETDNPEIKFKRNIDNLYFESKTHAKLNFEFNTNIYRYKDRLSIFINVKYKKHLLAMEESMNCECNFDEKGKLLIPDT